MTHTAPQPHFGQGLDHVLYRAGHGDTAFGRNVLDALVRPLREAATAPRSDRRWGPGVLGCTMWMDDPELLEVLGTMANVCIVITKQPISRRDDAKFQALETLARTNGLAKMAYPELDELAPRASDDSARVVRPYGASPAAEIDGVRELGFRRVGNRLVPIVHAKILLLGDMGWSDEHPSGHVSATLYFTPRRLWVGSANFTASSRHSLEMGTWTADARMLTAARTWLLKLVELSEPLRSPSDDLHPEHLPVEYDDVAIAEYLRDRSFNIECPDHPDGEK